ncbi:MAG TPA: serine/threonine-protein kinase [Polyangiaceae bacterium]|nr:serine/threonine-protein kinase [Polyangiaceae bacterium]
MAERQDRIGQVIAQRYELLSIVGRGGQGIVYRARDRWMAREVALKLMGSKAVRGPQVLERLMREQQAMLALRGTAAVELFDVCRGNEGELCLVMELLRGTDLDEHLYSLEQRGERLTLPRIVEIFDPIVSTLEIAHAAGILHRDLKPANVFLLEGGGVRLLDFGMARLKKSAPLTAAGTVMGSPSFMAPEAWQGVSDLMDNRADVFSLGVILFRLLAGELPFGGTSVQEKYLRTTSGQHSSLAKARPDLPRGIDDWAATALALDREQRFGNVRALWSAFLAVLHLRAPSNKPPSIWAAAKGAVQRMVGSNQPAKNEGPSSDNAYTLAALARSTMNVPPEPTKPPVEATIELSDAELAQPALPPARKPPPPRRPPPPRPVEKTLETTDADFVEKTLDDGAAPPKEP